MEKGQGALEYLLLIGGAVVVATIVIMVLLNISASGGSISKTQLIAQELRKYDTLGLLRAQYSYEGTLNDSSKNKYNGSGAGTYAGGKIGSAWQGNAGVSYSIPGGAVNGLSDFTFMSWVRYAGGSVIPQSIFGVFAGILLPSATTFSLSLSWNPPNVATYIEGTGNRGYNTGNLLDGQWHHIAWVKQGTTETIYADCTPYVYATPVAIATVNVDTSNILYFHSNSATVDETYIISRALGRNEIKALAGC